MTKPSIRPADANAVHIWDLRRRALPLMDSPLVMGIVNVTPDSFSDGGRFFDHDLAIKHALELDADGADILDVGGESTRPYSQPVGEDEERERVVPVIAELVKRTETPISVDTSKAAVAVTAIEAGAQIINDVTGLEGDPEMIAVALRYHVGVCAMHMQGTPQTMQNEPTYHDVTSDILHYLRQRRDVLLEAGIAPHRLCLDPGIGFGKTHHHNLQLMQNCRQLLELNCPILVGHSRKGFIGKALGDSADSNRDYGTLAATLWLAQQGMHIVRVHNVQAAVAAFKVWKAIEDAGSCSSTD